ncbi:MAG: hypothetical protein IBJ11_04930 [Phycisphaerales bacterium]|nr:hypothetical protein [Phycisphaerales bacterium]
MALLVAAGLAASACLAAAQDQPIQAGAGTIDGRDFANATLPAAVQRGTLSMAAVRGWAWRDRQTQRLLLAGDVRVTIGGNRFHAERAVVWIEPVRNRADGRDAEQVAVYFENVRELGVAPTVGVDGRALLVTAILVPEAPASLRVDVIAQGRPLEEEGGRHASFVGEGEARLARYLRSLAGGGDQQPPPAATIAVPRLRWVRPAADEPRPAVQGPPPAAPPAASSSGPPSPPPQPTPRPALPGAAPSGPVAPTGAGTGTAAAPPTSPRPIPPAPEPQPTLTELTRDTRGAIPPAERRPVVEPTQGTVFVSAPEVQAVAGDEPGTTAVVATGGVAVQAQRADGGRGMQISAQRAVVFLRGGTEAGAAVYRTENVEGVYLEGSVVASDGRYTLRGPRMYYDVRTDRAVVLDAVFWTYDEARGMPLYVRAEAIRQRSRTEWAAEKVTLANTSFAEPHFSIGAGSVTITRTDPPEAEAAPKTLVDARGVSFRAGSLPLFAVPRLSGELRPSVLRKIAVDSQGGDPVLRTVWDVYTLLGVDAPPDSRFDALVDGYFRRGVGLGTDLRWKDPRIAGSLFGYWIYDTGTDRLPSGADIDRSGEHRGIIAADNIWRLNDRWTLFAEGSYISDPAFLPAFFPDLAQTRREFVSSLYARRVADNEIFSMEARGTFNDFVANEWLLQSRGYAAQKLPEVKYARIGENLFNLLSYTGEASYSRVDLRFSDARLREYGLDTVARSREAFGLLPGDSLADQLRTAGVPDSAVNRFDTRHEIEMPLSAGPLNVVPFGVGRLTAWDSTFRDFNREDQDHYRFWGAAGVRTYTSIVRVDDGVRSEFLDLYRLRHIIEPSVTVWQAGSTINQSKLPVLDDSVERLPGGFTTRAGLRNTWQTQRGGEGRWRSVDWLVLNTDYVWSNGVTPVSSPFGRFIEARPEGSNLGRFFDGDGKLQLTDGLALTGSVLYDERERRFARTTTGFLIDHGGGFSTFVDYRELNPVSARFIDFGARYELTRKYAVSGFGAYDLSRNTFQFVGGRVTRLFPQWAVEVSVSADTIRDTVSASFVLRPIGFGGTERVRTFTREADVGRTVDWSLESRPERLDDGPFAR